jgi:hypothetical protein
VSRMREELRLAKMIGKPTAEAIPMSPRGEFLPREQTDVEKALAKTKADELWRDQAAGFDMTSKAAMDLAHNINNVVAPQKTATEQWAAFGTTAINVNSQIGQSIDKALSVPWNAVAATMAGITGDWDTMGAKATENQATIQTAMAGVGQAIWSAITQPLTDAKTAWDNLKAAMSTGVSVPSPTPAPAPAGVPGAQFGGIFHKPTIAQIGEAGPEAVIPLSGGRRAAGLLGVANRALGMGAAGPTSVSFAPNITINGNADESAQRAMDSRLRDLAADFIAQFKAAQYQERRLSYESGYG